MKILHVVAHPDDDLLFMSPPLLQFVERGDSITTLYLTAGDGGLDTAYWQGREQGVMAAYASMVGGSLSWTTGTITPVPGAAGLTSVSATHGLLDLAFLRLPDGNVDGSGFASTGHVSLKKLLAGDITAMSALDGGGSYSAATVRATIAGLVTTVGPDLVMLQDFVHANAGPAWSDHADHLAGSVFAFWAVAQAGTHAVVTAWEGYQAGASQAANISNAALLAAKQAAFAAYYAHDNQINPAGADWSSTYGAWLQRACPTGQYIF